MVEDNRSKKLARRAQAEKNAKRAEEAAKTRKKPKARAPPDPGADATPGGAASGGAGPALPELDEAAIEAMLAKEEQRAAQRTVFAEADAAADAEAAFEAQLSRLASQIQAQEAAGPRSVGGFRVQVLEAPGGRPSAAAAARDFLRTKLETNKVRSVAAVPLGGGFGAQHAVKNRGPALKFGGRGLR